MHDNFTSARDPEPPQYRVDRSARTDRAAGVASRPDRFAFWAVCLALVAMFAGVASADGASGGLGAGGGGGGDSQPNARKALKTKYAQLWSNHSKKARRWARRTSKCESGHNPKAIGGGGKYRGAFQFMRQTWRSAPRSPGGDPIRHTWKTQAVVAIAHRNKAKRKGWPDPWPNCPKPRKKKR